MTRRLGEGDVSGAAQVLLNTLAPLPDIDIPRLRRALERAAWRAPLMLRSKDAPWWERTSAAISVAMVRHAPRLQDPHQQHAAADQPRRRRRTTPSRTGSITSSTTTRCTRAWLRARVAARRAA
jgi:hypothetical protein